MSNTTIKEALIKYNEEKCTVQYAPTTLGQLEYYISCIPTNAKSLEEMKCMTPNNLPKDVNCNYLYRIAYAKVPDRTLICYTRCKFLSIADKVLPSTAPSAPPNSSALNLYPNFVLSFCTLFVFVFVFFKSKR